VSALARGAPWPLLLVIAVCAVIYGRGLANAPIHVHLDEIFFGLQAYSIAGTGHDTNGRLLPLYFQIGNNVWYQPIAIYSSALLLKWLPLSDATIRLSTVLVGLVNVGLLYLVAVRVLRHVGWALVAATLLALTPAHFIHSRVAVDYLYPLPFVLVWLVCLLGYRERPRPWLLFAATTSLGLGFYSYIASVVMMPIYLLLTWLMLSLDRTPWRAYVVALAGFAWPLLFVAAFLLAHPEIPGDFQARYSLEGSGPRLDPLQAARGALNSRNIAERANLYYDFFSPGFLFVSGGSNVTNSTREAGVFLAPFVVFLAIGLYDVFTRFSREKLLILLGFLTAPIAACIVVENYAIDRALALLPFGVLLATLGIVRMWHAASRVPLVMIYGPLSATLVTLSLVYMGWTLSTRGEVSGSPPWLLAVAALLFAFGRWIDRTEQWRPLVVLLLSIGVFQFQYFYRDYFGDYGARSAAWYGNNIQGAIERALALDGERHAPKVLLDERIRHIDSYWRFYLQVHQRQDLLPKAELFHHDTLNVDVIPAEALLICPAEDEHAEELAARGVLRRAAAVADPNDYYSPLGPGEHVTFVIYRKVGTNPR
jgi:4-amino-4-deoxy-L-arabinose transferase-like glycosyltransferase